MKKRRYSVLCALLALVCALSLLPAGNSYAVGEHYNVDRTKTSSLLIVGDCLVCGMADYVKKPSYNGTVGAHYIYYRGWVTGRWATRNMVIGSDRYTAQMKTLVKKALKKHGECTVVIVGTENDTGMAQWEKNSIKGMKKLKKALRSVKVKGKRAEVYLTSVIPNRGHDGEVKKFNKMLKKDQGKYYIYLGLTSTWRNYYAGSSHLNSKGLKILYKKLVKATEGKEKKAKKAKKAKKGKK